MHNLFVLTHPGSEYSDEMLHNAAFHQGLHCLLTQKRSSEKKIQSYFEIVTYYPSNYTMDPSKVIASIQEEGIHYCILGKGFCL